MKAVALGVVFFGYVVLVYGVNHVTNGCASFTSVLWPGKWTGDPCTGLTTSSATNTTPSATAPGPKSVNAAAGSGA